MGEWPEFLIIGAAKCGTTSLHAYLDRHPEVWMLPEREVGFFGRQWKHAEAAGPEALAEAREAYLARFDAAPAGTVRGECSNGYLWHRDVPARIHSVAPGTRLVLLVRDPVARAQSHYLMNVRNGRETRSFDDAIDDGLDPQRPGPSGQIQAGLYGKHVGRFLQHFPMEQIHIICLPELKEHPMATLRGLCTFLGVDPVRMPDIVAERHNAARMPRNALAGRLLHGRMVRTLAQAVPLRLRRFLGERVLMRRIDKPALPSKTKARLIEVYDADLRELERLTGRDFSVLRRSWAE